MTNKKSIIDKLLRLGAVILLTIVLFLTSRAAVQRMASFGCFDQCFNFVAAYNFKPENIKSKLRRVLENSDKYQ